MMTADVSQMNLKPFDPIDYDNYDDGPKGGGTSYAPPAEGRYTGRIAALPDDGSDVISSTNSFGRTQEGYLKVQLPDIEILEGTANGYKVKYTRLSSKKYAKKNGSQALDFLRACGIDARPQSEAELRSLLKQTVGRPFQFQLIWQAYDKNSETEIRGAENFPLLPDGVTRQSWIKDKFDDTKRWFANGTVRYFVSAFNKQQ
jgi:hypothetical protein